MAKDKTRYPQEGEKKTAVVSPDYPAKPRTYTLIFKHNRSCELHVGRELIRFEPNEVKRAKPDGAPFTDDFLNDPDFTAAMKKRFVIKENTHE
jgi:hypothetical protein